MDTISRESNRKYPLLAGALAGILVGVVVMVFCGVTLAKVNSLTKRVEMLSDQLASVESKASSLGTRVPENLPDQLASLESSASSAATAADKASKDIVQLTRSTQAAFDSIGPEIGNLKASITKLEEAAKARAAAPKAVGKGGEARVAGPGEYVVKPGDTGTKIAKAVGVSITELEAVNPGIDWRRLRVGQTVKTK
jgi:LysM repeat protein